jgi:hypothetical protein
MEWGYLGWLPKPVRSTIEEYYVRIESLELSGFSAVTSSWVEFDSAQTLTKYIVVSQSRAKHQAI